VLELRKSLPIFIGFKLESGLRRQLESLAGPDRQYVSADDSTYLRLCRAGDDLYVGKLIHEPLTTGRVDDVRRNIVSILQRLCPEVRLPREMEILAGSSASAAPTPGDEAPPAGDDEGEPREQERLW
jgi:hypothetical protein